MNTEEFTGEWINTGDGLLAEMPYTLAVIDKGTGYTYTVNGIKFETSETGPTVWIEVEAN